MNKGTNCVVVISDEIETTMRLMGVTSLDQLNDYYINTSAIENDITRRIDFKPLKYGVSSKL